MEKHKQIKTNFKINYKGFKGLIVQPLNGETDKKVNDVSWSHGITHLRVVKAGASSKYIKGQILHCGIRWFEKYAEEAE